VNRSKVRASVCEDADEIFMKVYTLLDNTMQHCTAVSGKYQYQVPCKVNQRGVPVCVHKRSAVPMTTVDDCGFELTDHPPYSPDLASTDFRLFPNLNKYLVSAQFTTDHAVMIAAETHLSMQDKAV